MIKISFSGDVTCDRPMLKATRKKNYDFKGMLTEVSEMFKDSDYVVGNLETVFGSDSIPYNKYEKYNSPDSLIEEISQNGFTMLTTANNHIYDCGSSGINRTLEILDRAGIESTGTKLDVNSPDYLICEFNNVRIAFFAYTYGINVYPEVDYENDKINSLTYIQKNVTKKKRKLEIFHKLKIGTKIRRLLKIPTMDSWIDFAYDGIFNKIIMQNLSQKIRKAKNECDLVIFCLHAGGQFNEVPGDYVETIMNFLEENGVDAVIGHHPHTIQKIENRNGKPYSFSLGGLSMSPSADYIHHECKPEYSLILNIYIDESSKKIVKTTFSFTKGTEDRNHFLRVRPVHKIYNESKIKEKQKLCSDIGLLLSRIYEKEVVCDKIKYEYDL